MHKWIVMLMLAVAAPAFLLSGCSITGQTAGVMHDNIVSCSLNTRIDFIKLSDDVQACYSDNGIYFAIENLGSTAVSALSVRLEADYNLTMLIREPAAPGSAVQQSLSFGKQGLKGAKSLTIYPVIGSDAGSDICVEAGITSQLERC